MWSGFLISFKFTELTLKNVVFAKIVPNNYQIKHGKYINTHYLTDNHVVSTMVHDNWNFSSPTGWKKIGKHQFKMG